MTAALIDDLAERGLIMSTTDLDALRDRLDSGPATVYCGFDPTADSLHIGSLVPLLLLRRFQEAGHRVLPLAGGATGMIGDPSGRSDERTLLGPDDLDRNLDAIKRQLAAFVSFDETAAWPAAVLVDNRDWTVGIGVLDFLRDVGKHVTVNTMLAKESVKSRLESEQGISFTEFSYMLLQANDFYELHLRHGCEVQVGGSDQWGNITAGIDLIRRRTGQTAHGLTVPLVTRSDGSKFGKTAAGTVWLDAHKTLPYEMYQYFLNVDDRDVERFLLQLTMLPVGAVAAVVDEHEADPARRSGQRALAEAVVALVHGAAQARRAELASGVLFGADVSAAGFEAVRGIVPETEVAGASLANGSLVDLLVETGLASSRKDAQRTLAQNGVSVNGVKRPEDEVGAGDLVGGRYILLQKGKKNRHLAVLVR